LRKIVNIQLENNFLQFLMLFQMGLSEHQNFFFKKGKMDILNQFIEL